MRNGLDRESNSRPQRWPALMLISNIDLTTAPLWHFSMLGYECYVVCCIWLFVVHSHLQMDISPATQTEVYTIPLGKFFNHVPPRTIKCWKGKSCRDQLLCLPLDKQIASLWRILSSKVCHLLSFSYYNCRLHECWWKYPIYISIITWENIEFSS
jgi:hypothetical protein